MESNKKTDEVLLTSQLYESILSENSKEILKLKELQNYSLEKILEKSKEIKEQKRELEEIRKEVKAKRIHIKLCRRVLKKERRKLKGINSSLKFERDVIMDLNANFIDEEKQHIKLKEFTPYIFNKKKR